MSEFGVATLLALFLNLLHAPAVVLLRLLLELLDLGLELIGAAAPGVAVSLDLVLLSLQIGQGFLEGGGKLLLGHEMFLDEADAGFLVFLDLGDGHVLAGRTRSGGYSAGLA